MTAILLTIIFFNYKGSDAAVLSAVNAAFSSSQGFLNAVVYGMTPQIK